MKESEYKETEQTQPGEYKSSTLMGDESMSGTQGTQKTC